LNDHQLLRYSRHILLDEIGIDRQQRLLDAHALIIGAGGLGSPVALYLASAGIGKITIVDDDIVDLTNLQRQVMHTTSRIGQPKALSAKIALADINPTIEVNALVERVDKTRLAALLIGVTVVLDCSDNFNTRHAINQACVTANVPLVSGAAIRFDGQISVFDPRDPRSGCYACLFAPDAEFEEERCATMGVFAPLVGIIGALQAAEALKVVGHIGTALTSRLLLFDARYGEWTTIAVPRDPNCTVCRSRPHASIV
jgi:molybdopterin/thiamine biosynthesis adenylyltransferase